MPLFITKKPQVGLDSGIYQPDHILVQCPDVRAIITNLINQLLNLLNDIKLSIISKSQHHQKLNLESYLRQEDSLVPRVEKLEINSDSLIEKIDKLDILIINIEDISKEACGSCSFKSLQTSRGLESLRENQSNHQLVQVYNHDKSGSFSNTDDSDLEIHYFVMLKFLENNLGSMDSEYNQVHQKNEQIGRLSHAQLLKLRNDVFYEVMRRQLRYQDHFFEDPSTPDSWCNKVSRKLSKMPLEILKHVVRDVLSELDWRFPYLRARIQENHSEFYLDLAKKSYPPPVKSSSSISRGFDVLRPQKLRHKILTDYTQKQEFRYTRTSLHNY